MEDYYRRGEWSPLASFRTAEDRSEARRELHGFDFRVESAGGAKTIVKIW